MEECYCCGKPAKYETCVSGVYICDEPFCLTETARSQFIEGELDNGTEV